MSITKATKTHRTLRSKIALVSAVSLSLAAGSVALAAPAQAAGSVPQTASAQASSLFLTGQVTFQKPYFAGFTASGTKLLAYPGKVVFPSGGHLVQVRHQLWEDDWWPNTDDFLGARSFTKYVQNDGTFNFKSIYPLIRTESDGTEEVYQRVSYRVYKHGQWSAWSKWVYSGIYRM